MNRILMFFIVLECFLSVVSCFLERILICFVERLLELDCVFRLSEKNKNHVIY